MNAQATQIATEPTEPETGPTVAQLNDLARSGRGGAKICMTRGVYSLPPALQDEILAKTISFNDFTNDNDPHGEHDFGNFHAGQKGTGSYICIYWKIDYYNTDLTAGSNDPRDPAQTKRVLTIMLAEEY